MKKLLILLMGMVSVSSIYSADNFLDKKQSILILENAAPSYTDENSVHVDFFESWKQQEQDRINQDRQDLESWHEIQSQTSNMSPHDRAQYYLEHRHFDALNAHGYEQQINSLQKARNRGVISDRDYQQKIVKQQPMPMQHRSSQLKLSIPIGD
ncbi:hypothetical protein [Acinetobacter sp. A47]|uniref:hypothetical protein n=1 Tax=Acinetobacter sp. A47 TaxID=1561217 RepID=UPI0005701D7A|nr:hypothetical protein [Acinetobacter sp. A47]